MSNKINNENLDKKVEDCRQKFLKCPSWRDSQYQSLDELSDALFDRFHYLGGIEYRLHVTVKG